jgi:CHAT domain-containing protein
MLSRFALIHLATHALVRDDFPERSALVLSQVGLTDALSAALAGEAIEDGLLTGAEIVQDWLLDAELVTLSACETGLGRALRSEGYLGLVNAFLQAGARSVVASLWQVEDQATALLMERFYDNLRRGLGDQCGSTVCPRAAALGDAKRWLRDYRDAAGRRPYEHPYFWSAFVLIGDAGICAPAAGR